MFHLYANNTLYIYIYHTFIIYIHPIDTYVLTPGSNIYKLRKQPVSTQLQAGSGSGREERESAKGNFL